MNSLTPGELEVMEVLWQHGSLKPAEILEHLDRPLTNPALRSVLRVLLEKGHVTRRKNGKAYHYRSRKAAPIAFKKMTERLADIFCGGSSFELIAQLIKSENLSEGDLRRLQKIAREAKSESTSSPPIREEQA